MTEPSSILVELRRMNRLYAVLTQVNQMLIRAVSRDELLAGACRTAVDCGGFKAAWIGWLEPESRAVLPVAWAGGPEENFGKFRIFADAGPEGRGPSGTALREGVTAIFNDFQGDPRTADWHPAAVAAGVRSAASFPIRFGGAIRAVLSLYDTDINTFQKAEIDLLERVAENLSYGLDRIDQEGRERRAEESLKESELRYRTVVKGTGQIVYDFDFSRGVVQWEGAVTEVAGYDRDEMRRIDARGRQELIHPEDRPQALALLEKALERGTRYQLEYRLRRKDGSYITVEEHGSFLTDSNGRVSRMLATICDITERKKLETQFLRSQRMESIGTLAGGIAHDLNNVLAPIMMAVQLLETELGGSERRRLLEMIRGSTQRGVDLVKQVLSFCRGVEGRRVELDVASPIRDLHHILRETFPKSIQFEVSLADELWPVVADSTQLNQVLLNLCVNARDAMPNGGALNISVANVMLDAQSAVGGEPGRTGPHVMIAITDNGMGIPPDIREKIFDPFFTTKGPGKGTGLGLSTSLVIVKSHGGFINLYSEPGKGTAFKVYLPASPGAKTARLRAAAPAIPRGNGELILLVDDEESVRSLARQALQMFGYRVAAAGNGAEAIELYARHAADVALLLTDMTMPGMDGPATIEALVRINPKLKVIAASGLTPDAYQVNSQPGTETAFLLKPYTAEKLLGTVHEVLHGRTPAAVVQV